MTRLSVNINKVALLRNSRGGSVPNLLQVAKDCERFGAQGITVHPRPDERHVKRSDIMPLKEIVTTEFNIEGYPSDDFVEMVLKANPAQVTLVPDAPGQLTSDHGWDAIKEMHRLQDLSKTFKEAGIRLSIFLDPAVDQVEAAAKTGTDRIEFYTGPYAAGFRQNSKKAVSPYVDAGKRALEVGLGINAGHDLDRDNLAYFVKEVPEVLEVSIGHALIGDALYYGLENTISMFLRACKG
ncbi:MAG: pyridoxine 5'-phosphate synthase [Saprospiraceae bacterium]